MKKQVELKKLNSDYILKLEDDEIVINNKKIDAQSIYQLIYSNLPLDDNNVKIEVKSSLSEKEDKIIYNQIVELFKFIDESINKQLSASNQITNNE